MALTKDTDPRMRGAMVLMGTVWRFRIDRGPGTHQVPVELRGRTIHGSIRDGDTVEVVGPWRHGQELKPKWVLNLHTGVRVEPEDWSLLWNLSRGQWVVVALIVAIAVAVFAYFGLQAQEFWDEGRTGLGAFRQTMEAERATFEQEWGQQGRGQEGWLQTCLQMAFSPEARDWCYAVAD